MTASFACDPAEMTRLKGRHDTLRGTVDEITLPSGAINWGFLVVNSGYSKLDQTPRDAAIPCTSGATRCPVLSRKHRVTLRRVTLTGHP